MVEFVVGLLPLLLLLLPLLLLGKEGGITGEGRSGEEVDSDTGGEDEGGRGCD